MSIHARRRPTSDGELRHESVPMEPVHRRDAQAAAALGASAELHLRRRLQRRVRSRPKVVGERRGARDCVRRRQAARLVASRRSQGRASRCRGQASRWPLFGLLQQMEDSSRRVIETLTNKPFINPK